MSPVDRIGVCSGCGQTKKIKAKGKCHRCYNRAWNRSHREQVSAANQGWRERNPDKLRDSRARRQRDPLKRRAQAAVSNAIRDGKLTRQPCEVCGGEPTEGHHDDYSKPLDVRWLCRDHHVEEHLAPDPADDFPELPPEAPRPPGVDPRRGGFPTLPSTLTVQTSALGGGIPWDWPHPSERTTPMTTTAP